MKICFADFGLFLLFLILPFPILPVSNCLFFHPLSTRLTFEYVFCVCVLIFYSRSSKAIVPPIVPDDLHASQSSQPAALIGDPEPADRRQCLFVSFVHSGSWRPGRLQLQVRESQGGRREPFPVMFTLTAKGIPFPTSVLLRSHEWFLARNETERKQLRGRGWGLTTRKKKKKLKISKNEKKKYNKNKR